MPEVFISYAREDAEFVRRLSAALVSADREPWVDREEIMPADRWLESIHEGIDSTDSFVVVISPDSVSSTVCGEELAHAIVQHKRLVPVVWRDPGPDVPTDLASLNWIFLRETDDFDAGIQSILRALDTDIDLVRIHTKVLTRAKAWETGVAPVRCSAGRSCVRPKTGWQGPPRGRSPSRLIFRRCL